MGRAKVKINEINEPQRLDFTLSTQQRHLKKMMHATVEVAFFFSEAPNRRICIP